MDFLGALHFFLSGVSWYIIFLLSTNGLWSCGPAVQVSYYPNDLLDQLTAKYVYRKQALSSLRLMDPGALGAAAGGGAAERKTTDTLRR